MTKGHQKGSARRKSSRFTITFPRQQYRLLERIAKDMKVLLAWVIRFAAEQCPFQRYPLFCRSEEAG